MKLKKFGVILGLTVALTMTACAPAETQPAEVQGDEAVVQETDQVATEEGAVDFSMGFETSKLALDAYMGEIVAKDYEKAYEALHQIDKDTFTAEAFADYQASMQLVKDMHGYSVHDTQSFWNFEFSGVMFEQVDFYDLDYAYVQTGEAPMPVEDTDDHDHDHASDYTTHDHGHDMATMGVAAVKRNGDWFILQGLSTYEMEDLTRKYANQSIALGMEQKPEYVLGELIPIGNMIISVNDAFLNPSADAYVLDVTFINTGFETLNTAYFTDKFALIDSDLNNYYSKEDTQMGGLSGIVRAGSFARGTIQVPVKAGFESDAVYFMMNTIDPSKTPIPVKLSSAVEANYMSVYGQLQRKPAAALGQAAAMDGLALETSNVTFDDAASGSDTWTMLTADVEISNLSDSILYFNQVGLSLRSSDGTPSSLMQFVDADKLEGVSSKTFQIHVPVKKMDTPLELTLCVFDTRPNNSVTQEIER